MSFAAKGRKGRQALIHSQEDLLQEGQALQQSADSDQYRRRRVVAEHRLARREQLGIRPDRPSHKPDERRRVNAKLPPNSHTPCKRW